MRDGVQAPDHEGLTAATSSRALAPRRRRGGDALSRGAAVALVRPLRRPTATSVTLAHAHARGAMSLSRCCAPSPRIVRPKRSCSSTSGEDLDRGGARLSAERPAKASKFRQHNAKLCEQGRRSGATSDPGRAALARDPYQGVGCTAFTGATSCSTAFDWSWTTKRSIEFKKNMMRAAKSALPDSKKMGVRGPLPR
jgi:hypothetical protein